MKWTGLVKQVSHVRRSGKHVNAEFVDVTLKSYDGRFTLKLRLDPGECPELYLNDTVEVDMGLELKVRQEAFAR